MIGNSRLHWGLFVGETLHCTWDTDYLPDLAVQQLATCQSLSDLFPKILLPITHPPLPIPLFVASVVPSQTEIWQTYPHSRVITLDQVLLKNTYPTLGIDRALAVWGAGQNFGFPILVIDAGTALTFTGADGNGALVGGAILPGLGLQLAAIGQKTAQLPLLDTRKFVNLPPRFARTTPEAITSGVIYILMAGICDFVTTWLQDFPQSRVVITGGDASLLLSCLQSQFPEVGSKLILEKDVIFWGMAPLAISH